MESSIPAEKVNKHFHRWLIAIQNPLIQIELVNQSNILSFYTYLIHTCSKIIIFAKRITQFIIGKSGIQILCL